MLSTLPFWARCGRSSLVRRGLATTSWTVSKTGRGVGSTSAAATTVLALTAAVTWSQYNVTHLAAKSPVVGGGEVITTGTPVREPSTGILFPQLCNGYFLTGCGVRYKYGLVKVYAVGTYLDPLAMSAVKTTTDSATLQQALCNPTYPRTIRIVMARSLSMQKFTDAIVEALLPRMKGKDLEKLEEFKKMNPPLDMVKGAELELTIRGDTLLYKNAVGNVGTIHSEVFTAALCDVFYGDDAVSPTHKAAVLAGLPKL